MGNFLFRRRVSWLTGILTLVVALSGCLGGGGSTYQVTVVVEEGGNPLPGVEVSYSGTVSGAGGVTDDLGQVRIASLEGEIEIHFLLEGYTFDPHPLLVNGSGTYTVNAEALPPEQVATPLITLSESNAQNREPGLTFTVEAVEGVSFYYTLDGSDPTEESSKYEGEVSLTAPDTDQEAMLVIRVVGVKTGFTDSEIAQVTVCYARKDQVEPPTIRVSKTVAQNREAGLTFTVEAVEGVSFYYTLDGSDPTEESLKYEGEVSLTAPDIDEESQLTIKVLGTQEGWLNSEIAEQSIIYLGKVALPIIKLDKTVAQNRQAGLTFTVEAVEGVSFYYTLDGSDPTEESLKYEGEVSLTAPDTDQEALLVIKVIGVRAGWSNSEVASASVTYQQEYFRFFEDFESYSEGEYPDSFFMRYDGTGGSNQKVISTESWDGSGGKVFRLEGAGSWASEQLVSLPDPLTEFIVVKAWVKPKRGSWPGRIGLYNQTVGTWGTRVSGVLFEGGKIKAMLDGADNSKIELSEYEEDRWYKVTMVHDLQSKTYDIYLDGVQVAADLGLHPTVDPTFLNLTAGNTGVNEIYFDDVEITFAFVGL